tara:strand:- start:2666 stop:3166 length:501 start_codon:yes stop_codon:yes gene_type:complete
MGRTKKDNTYKQTIMAQQYRIYTGVEAQDKFLDEDALISQQADMTIAINIFPHLLMSKKATVLLNPLYVMLHEGDNQDKVHDWGKLAARELMDYLMNKKKKKVDGKDWSCGCFGSKWKDMELKGIFTRVCFYSRKFDPKMFEDAPEVMELEGKDYLLMLDPHVQIE